MSYYTCNQKVWIKLACVLAVIFILFCVFLDFFRPKRHLQLPGIGDTYARFVNEYGIPEADYSVLRNHNQAVARGISCDEYKGAKNYRTCRFRRNSSVVFEVDFYDDISVKICGDSPMSDNSIWNQVRRAFRRFLQ